MGLPWKLQVCQTVPTSTLLILSPLGSYTSVIYLNNLRLLCGNIENLSIQGQTEISAGPKGGGGGGPHTHTWEPYQSSKRVTRKRKIIVRNKVFESQGGGGRGRYSHFFFIRRLGPSIYRSSQNKYQEFQAPPKIFEILATPKISPILYLDLKKRP